MKIGIISDTHDKDVATQIAVDDLMRRGAEALIHCGDIMGTEVLRICSHLSPCYFVAGNNDPSAITLKRFAEKEGLNFLRDGGVISLGSAKIAVTHGHDKAIVKKLLQTKPDFLLLGHSHQRRDDIIGETRVINPGALHRSASKSYALLDLSQNCLEFILLSSH